MKQNFYRTLPEIAKSSRQRGLTPLPDSEKIVWCRYGRRRSIVFDEAAPIVLRTTRLGQGVTIWLQNVSSHLSIIPISNSSAPRYERSWSQMTYAQSHSQLLHLHLQVRSPRLPSTGTHQAKVICFLAKRYQITIGPTNKLTILLKMKLRHPFQVLFHKLRRLDKGGSNVITNSSTCKKIFKYVLNMCD